MMKNKRYSPAAFSWILVPLLAAFAVLPALLYPIEEYTQDAASFHIYRGIVLSAARAEGWFYPRWAQPINGGLGGPLFSFISPLALILMNALNVFGISIPLGWRLVAAFALLAGALGAFRLTLSLFKRADVALLSAACFVYAPHLLVDIFERGSPQGLAITIYPWILWALLRLAENPSGLRLAIAGLFWAIALLFHTAAAIWLLPVIGLFLIFLVFRSGRRALPLGLAALLLGSLLVAFYLVPFAGDRPNIQWENNHRELFTQPALNPVPLDALLALPPIFDVGSGHNPMGRGLGLLHVPLLLAGLGYGLVSWRRQGCKSVLLPAGLAVLGLVSIWLQTASATPIWKAFPFLNFLEFRWRLQSTLGLLAALILGWLLAAWPHRFRSLLVPLLIVAYVGLQVPSLYPVLGSRWADFSPPPTVAEVQASALRLKIPGLSAFDEELPVWRTLPFTEKEAQRVAATPLANLPEGGRIIAEQRRTGSLQVQLATPVAFDAAMHVLYYPGWAGYVDGQRQPIRPMERTGYLLLAVPAGNHTISLRYEGTPAQHIGDLLSGLMVVLSLLLAFLWRGQRDPALVVEPVYLQPRWWLPAVLVVLIGAKFFWIDPHTTWFRWASTCLATHGAQVQTDVRFGEGIHLCGYRLSRTQLGPGDTLQVVLYWQTDRPLEKQMAAFVHLLGTVQNPQAGYPGWGQHDKEMPGDRQLIHWEPGKIYPDVYDLQLPPNTPEGDYRLEIGWWDPTTGRRLDTVLLQPAGGPVSASPDALLVAGITVRRSGWQQLQQRIERFFLLRSIVHPRHETLGGTVRFLGYDLEPTLRPGQVAHLKLYWQAMAPVEGDYKVFTHLVDASGQARAGHDGIPANATQPTRGWAPYEVVTDLHELALPPDAAPGRYTVEIGLYDEVTGARLPAYDAAGARLEQDRILLGTIEVQ